MKRFTVGEDASHTTGDGGCAACWEGYPEPCRCGGLIHASGTTDEDPDGNFALATSCDQCGRSAEDLEVAS